jgi:tRNA threonylcarbamoyladenosine biosynthesis protein TsaB
LKGDFILKILCVDTSSKLCGVAILEDTTLIKKIELNNGLTHSETLMPIIKQLLDNCNLTLKNIDLLICDIGPGSFTGLRIGIATIKAFSDSLNIPCVGVSSLEVFAHSVTENSLICSTIDCKNNNCYFALYEYNSGSYTILEEPTAKSVDEVLNLLENKYSNKHIQFVGDCINCSDVINVENLGVAGYNKFVLLNNKNESDTSSSQQPEELLPLYLKKPQAQRQLEEKLNNA